MRLLVKGLAILAAAMALPANAATVLANGTYVKGESFSINVTPDIMFGIGTYRFRFESTTPLEALVGNFIFSETVVECIGADPCETYSYQTAFYDVVGPSPIEAILTVAPVRTETFAPDAYGNPGATFTYTESCCSFSLFQTDGVVSASGSWVITAMAVPEPETWLMLIIGFGLIGTFMRRDRKAVTPLA